MHLFNKRIIKQHCTPAPIPADHLAILQNWADMIRTNRILALNETALHGDFSANILQTVLGYRGASGGADYTLSAEQAILQGRVDLALGHFGSKNEIIAPFELKGAKTKNLDAMMAGRTKSPVQQAWEYASHIKGPKWVLISNMVELRLYAFGEGITHYELFRLDHLTDPAEYARFMLLLSAGNLLTGRTLNLLKASHEADKDITERLYHDYKSLRQRLIDDITRTHPAIPALEVIALAQKVLDRVLFVAFAEDTGLLPGHTLQGAYKAHNPFNPAPVWDNFKGLFQAIDQGNTALNIPRYNGGLFKQDDAINALNLPNDLCEYFKIIGEYDFGSEISVTVLGHIFEQSIADVERLQAKARGEEDTAPKTAGTGGRRKRDGVVYTPDHIARFIVDQTLGRHLNDLFHAIALPHLKGAPTDDPLQWRSDKAELKAWQAYQTRLKTLRIVDPACGSGVFLIMAFDHMKAELARVHNKLAELQGLPQTGDLIDHDSEILTHNLFGVDVNVESIEIAKLSLWVKTARPNKVLDTLDNNLKVGDSLIGDSNFAYLNHPFTWPDAFPHVFAEGGFDVVLGNPPYVRQERFSSLKPALQTRFETYHGVADLFVYFYERGLRLLKPRGRLGYISSSTFFKTGSGQPLRHYLRQKASLETVVDFGDLQIFGGVATLPAIVTMQNTPPAEGHELAFWRTNHLPEKFGKAFDAAKQPYPQSALTDASWELEPDRLRLLRDKIKTGKKTLKQVYGSPYRGVLTGLNAAFVIDTPTKDRLCAADPHSADIIKPFLEGKDLKRWRAEPRGLWLIFTRRGTDIDRYPAIKAHLETMRPSLEPKPKSWQPSYPQEQWPGRKAGNYQWFEIQDTVDYYPHFTEPKISYPHFSQGRKFLYDPDGYFSNDKSYIIPTDDMALLAILNSHVLWFILSSISPFVRGGFHEARAHYMEQLPIPTIPPDTAAQLAELAGQATDLAAQRRALQTAITRRIGDLSPAGPAKLTGKLQNWWDLPNFAAFQAEVKKSLKTDIPLKERSQWEDWMAQNRAQIHTLTARIAGVEAQINRLTYALFELGDDEIALLETALNQAGSPPTP